ncbi:DUF5134 domain-containing protein [Tessaracoccus rhinocerotis]|uniref:DUF5134 domain-containing protein n=1 Tax=Tessaracoccus rhinocerotis TaxID=1689449 RepID=A0A553JWR4_9ACTN|nr:DUF5134 domain-containing protein [Tessaracoccus rhinocerotis]TRY16917.1 DUF5134 domain-containing protein [Tessaracoccus rhinocerotis]
MDEPLTRWAFTVAFGLLACYLVGRVVAEIRKPLQAVMHLLHLLMAVVMVAMAWPWWGYLPALPQVLVFSAGAAWFVVLAVLLATGRVSHFDTGCHGPLHQVSHAASMLAMVWMLVVMAPTGDAPITHHHAALGAGAVLTGTAVTAAMAVSAVALLVETFDALRRPRTVLPGPVDAGSGVVMSAGMAAMCWMMLG